MWGRIRQGCVLTCALLISAVNAYSGDAPEAIEAAEAAAPGRQLATAVDTLWQQAVALASVDHDQKKARWAAEVNDLVVVPYLEWWQFSALLDRLLGDASQRPEADQYQALERVLEGTMARYVYEVLLDNAIDNRSLDAVEILDGGGAPHIHLSLRGPLGLPVQVTFFTELLDGQWRVVDMVVAGVQYSDWKGGRYQRYAKKREWGLLLQELKTKNHDFFEQFCHLPSLEPTGLGAQAAEQMRSSPTPHYLASACDS